MKRVIVVAPKGAIDAIKPLLNIYHQKFLLTLVDSGYDLPSWSDLSELAENQDALLLIGNRKYSPRTVFSSPFVCRSDGEFIPAAWLPYTNDEALFCFAENASKVHQRTKPEKTSIAVLGQWNHKFLNLADRIVSLISKLNSHQVLHWTSDRILRDDMIDGLNSGLALAVYVGHGRPIGWVGYRGTRSHHFSESKGKPIGALFSLCCETASRKRNGLSFSESLPLMGQSAATFAAVDKSLHMDNVRWATGICHAIRAGKEEIGEVIKAATPAANSSLHGYRIMGDPMAPLIADESAYGYCQNIGGIGGFYDGDQK